MVHYLSIPTLRHLLKWFGKTPNCVHEYSLKNACATAEAHLLQGRHKRLELGRSVLHKQQASQGVVEGGAVAKVGGVGQEREVICSRVVYMNVR